MQVITDEYRRLNETMHNTNPVYGVSGHLYSDDVLRLCMSLDTHDVLDYGCGKNTLANSLPFVIKKYDPAIRMFHEEPEPAEVVVCTDVMEHIEPECLDSVIKHIHKLTKKVAYLVIATRAANKTLEDGRNAHLIVEEPIWWVNKMSDLFHIVSMRDINGAVVFHLKPKTGLTNTEVQDVKQ